ncbi:MAG: hypothetical protein HIU85_10835 [Proteobacteria bacterium]|nr:hypothetical protein [Pseudomonadota bacterium]
MSELRWTLLILGVVFIAALSWWERRRPRQAFAPRLRDPSPGRPAGPPEPWIGDTEISDAVVSDVALEDAADVSEPGGEDTLRAHVDPSVPEPLRELPMLIIPDRAERVELQAGWDEAPPEPERVDPEPGSPVETQRDEIPGAEGVGAVRIVERFAAYAAAPEQPVPEQSGSEEGEPPHAPASGAAGTEPIVEWPPEESRRIVSLRLVAGPPERFAGRTLRLALAAEGFLLGKFSIFHKPDESNRALLSAASLTRPGAFDLETMDSQRYAGLSLFAVLPGPKTPGQAFEELLATARNLNERLQGALQDERGGPLTVLRVSSIRESLRAEAPDAAASAEHET